MSLLGASDTLGLVRRFVVLVALCSAACKKEPAGEPPKPVTPSDAAVTIADAAAPRVEERWYRASVTAPDGVEAWFFLSTPSSGTGTAKFRTGVHDVTSGASALGTKLSIPIAIHQTNIEATIGADGALAGTFSIEWGAIDKSSIPLKATPVPAPSIAALATLPADGTPLDLGAPKTFWKVQMKDSGIAKLVLEQRAPGELEGALDIDTGNTVYVAGNARGKAAVLTGFDGTAGYRIELTFDDKAQTATGKYFAGPRFDWRETFTAKRGEDFVRTLKPRPTKPGVKVKLPDHPALAKLPEGPLLVELAGSWCSTCRNAAPFIVELDKEYKARGLQVVTLLYELTGDAASDAKQAEMFEKAYGATWPVVPITADMEELAAKLPTGLQNIDPGGFPITLFIAKDRTLAAVHAGFPAAHLKEESARVKAEFRKHVEEILKK